MRFSDLGLTTGATDNQRTILGGARQSYPADTSSMTTASVTPAPSYGGVSRSALPEVQSAAAAADDATRSAAATASNLTTNGATMVASATTATSAAAGAAAGGWNAAGGTRVTIAPGETLYSLSRRYGVPVGEILKANGIADGNSVQAGSQILIPTYAYSRNAPVSAPDNDPKVAAAVPGSGGNAAKGPAEPRPAPAAPREVATLPNAGGVREGNGTQASSAGTKPDAAASGKYKVAAGDTLHSIARKHNVTTTALQKANGLENGLIKVGQLLTIPGQAGGAAQTTAALAAPQPAVAEKADKVKAEPAVVRQEKLPQYTPPAKQQTEEVIQNARVEAPDSTGLGKMRWPARGRIIAEFGATVGGRKNDGIDIAVPEGTSIRAAENGVVIYAGDSLKDFGNTILLRHDNGLVTVYGHASQLKVQRGAVVKRGDEIALSGVTGATDVPKLHFEVRQNSVPVNPATYLQ